MLHQQRVDYVKWVRCKVAGSVRRWVRMLPALPAVLWAACSQEPAALGDADYAKLALPAACSALDGAAGATNGLQTGGGVAFNVRTPRNYDPTRAHPLLIVLPPAGFDRVRAERYAGLTSAATGAGFVIAYADHARMVIDSFAQQGEIPRRVAERWCIDPARVVFAGHSDGGSSAAAVTFLARSTIAPAAIVVSGSGIRAADLSHYACPAPVSVLILHSRDDARFPLPEFGADPVRWWAACGACAAQPIVDGDCVEHTRCRSGTRVRYCELSGRHEQWPAANDELLRFVQGARAAP